MTGTLCLEPESSGPYGPVGWLQAYIESATEWLSHAADGTLLHSGEAWELPDFRVGRTDGPPIVYSLESATSFSAWESCIGESGLVQFARHAQNTGLVPVRFDGRRNPNHSLEVAEAFLDRNPLHQRFGLRPIARRPAGAHRAMFPRLS